MLLVLLPPASESAIDQILQLLTGLSEDQKKQLGQACIGLTAAVVESTDSTARSDGNNVVSLSGGLQSTAAPVPGLGTAVSPTALTPSLAPVDKPERSKREPGRRRRARAHDRDGAVASEASGGSDADREAQNDSDELLASEPSVSQNGAACSKKPTTPTPADVSAVLVALQDTVNSQLQANASAGKSSV